MHVFFLQGHYRYCDALFSLGEFKRAIEANSIGQSLCKGDHEGFKELEQQQLRFIQAIKDLKGIFPACMFTEAPKFTYLSETACIGLYRWARNPLVVHCVYYTDLQRCPFFSVKHNTILGYCILLSIASLLLNTETLSCLLQLQMGVQSVSTKGVCVLPNTQFTANMINKPWQTNGSSFCILLVFLQTGQHKRSRSSCKMYEAWNGKKRTCTDQGQWLFISNSTGSSHIWPNKDNTYIKVV